METDTRPSSSPTISSSYLGAFTCRSLTCGSGMRIDDWMAVFGPDKSPTSGNSSKLQKWNDDDDDVVVNDTKTEEEDAGQVGDIIQVNWSVRSNRPGPNSDDEDSNCCDPTVCRLTSGVCVDCAKCSKHCTCKDSPFEEEEEVEPPVCDPKNCRQLICGDCSRCTNHCVCHWEYKRRPRTTRRPKMKPLGDNNYITPAGVNSKTNDWIF